jgi:hypothetical protein
VGKWLVPGLEKPALKPGASDSVRNPENVGTPNPQIKTKAYNDGDV